MSAPAPDERDADVGAPGGAGEDTRQGAASRADERSAERARDAAETSRDRFAFLAETSRVLAASLDYEPTLTTVAGMSLPYLGAWCIVDVCTTAGGIRRVAVLHPDPARQALARELHERFPPNADDSLGAPRAIRTGRPELVAEVSDDAMRAVARDAEHLRLLRALGIGAYVIVPMVARDRVLGAITFVTTEAGRRFGDLDLVLAEDLANRAAMAVDNARLHAEALEARRAADAARRDAEAAWAQAEVARVDAEAARTQAQAARAEAEGARDEAEAASRAKSEFLAVMSHELRTPLNAIGGYAELIELGVHGPVTAEQHVDLERLQQSQRHLLGLIDGVLNFSRVEAGAVLYAVEDMPLGPALAACEAMTAPQFSARRIAFDSAACDPALRLRADPEKLQQILLNLLTNALKFTEPGGRVTVRCAAGIGTVAVSVTDTGNGIPADQLGRVFEPFVQVDSRLTRPHQGLGLGLAISRDLARGMGGDLTVESTPGVGSAFTLTLPGARTPGP